MMRLRIDNLDEKMKSIDKNFDELMRVRKSAVVWKKALRIALIYAMIGSLWILLSDKILTFFVKDIHVMETIQLFKGWFYVGITALLFYFMIKRALALFDKATDMAVSSFEELSAAHEELMAMSEEMDSQYENLLEHQEALRSSEERYALVVEGATDGIWDWNILTGDYYFSKKWMESFGYQDGELPLRIESWRGLVHPDDQEKVNQTLALYLNKKDGIYENLYRLRNKSGEYRYIQSRGKAVWDGQGKPIRMAGSHTDITDKRYMEERLKELAYYDDLTGLPNRAYLHKEVSKAISNGEIPVLAAIDIDDFKHINDTMGHIEGDLFIIQVASVLRRCVPEPHIVSRTSGDQFVVVFFEKQGHPAEEYLERILLEFRKPIELKEQKLFHTVSIGAARYGQHAMDFSGLMQNADLAMYHQKENGKDGYCFFSQEMYENTIYYVEMSNLLREAIKKGEFELYYQPLIDIASHEIIAAEALIRWFHPVKGYISPMEFIPFAEKTAYIIPISEWVLKTAIEQKIQWNHAGFGDLKICINMSGHIFADRKSMNDIYSYLEQAAKKEKVNLANIELEVTETAIMLDLEGAKETLKKLKVMGVSISLDDFGTGYSSLTYLHKLPLDILKIDREFIKDIQSNKGDSYILKTIIDLAHNIHLKVVAEGVETVEQLEYLKENDCDIVQGYYFSKPLQAKELLAKIQESKIF